MVRTSSSKGKSRSNTPVASSAAARRRMLNTAQRDTPAELALRAELRRLGLRYRVNAKLPVSRRTADVAFNRLKIAVFVDGCFWHNCPKHGTWPRANAEWWRTKIEGNVARDRDTDARLRKAGWRVIRVWAHADPASAAFRVANVVNQRAHVRTLLISSDSRRPARRLRAANV